MVVMIHRTAYDRLKLDINIMKNSAKGIYTCKTYAYLYTAKIIDIHVRLCQCKIHHIISIIINYYKIQHTIIQKLRTVI